MACIFAKGMEDIISLSSGSDSDSDLEVVGCFSDATKEDARPFITTDWIPVKPVFIPLSKLRRRRPRRCQRDSALSISVDSTEVVDLSQLEEIVSDISALADSGGDQDECQILPSLTVGKKPKSKTTGTVKSLPPVCVDLTVPNQVEPILQPEDDCQVLLPATLNPDPVISVGNSPTAGSTEPGPLFQGVQLRVLERVDLLKSPASESILSALSHHNPSDVTPVPSLCEPNIPDFRERMGITDSHDQQSAAMAASCPSSHEASASNSMFRLTIAASHTAHTQESSVVSVSVVSRPSESSISSEHQHDVPPLQSSPTSPEEQGERLEDNQQRPVDDGHDTSNSLDESDCITMSDPDLRMPEELGPHQQQIISHIQLKKLKRHMGAVVEDVADDEAEEEGYGPPELLCRQGLSLVYSTIEENYPEGTLQLLSDFLQPRYYPPPDIMVHLLNGILLDPGCPDVLAVEAYSLLMRVQIFRPADIYNLTWDWELLTSVMDQQVGTKSLRLEVRRMLLQYVLQILEDDFQRHLYLQKLHLTITKAMLSCEQSFTHVRELISWLFEAVSTVVTCKERKRPIKEMNEHLRMVMLFQKMLVLTLEVDRTPTCSSNKLAQELFQIIIASPMREQRLLLLDTLESSLLRCKLLELLLDYECPQKVPIPMSLTLLLHFLQHTTLAPDPTDGSEDWRRWEELVKMIWMLLLSYEKVMKGHLRCSITDRSTYSRDPNWTVHDRVTRSMVQDASDAFLARAERDLGCPPPQQVQDPLALLRAHLQD